jgi:UDP-N-acetylglucosamine--N-acetylmuramyl-(pentapeptide) pyrophosphoryl-undecaprenol N-acetylglucosamine transferase
MSRKSFFFAGGGTGGHIYPSIAVAEKIIEIEPKARIHFFCSTRSIDAHILGMAGYDYIKLPAKGMSRRPGRLLSFCASFLKSYRAAKEVFAASDRPVVVGVGGFVAAPVCLAAHKMKVPLVLLNVDAVPGTANRIIARWADEIFVQFAQTQQYFAKAKANVTVVGCPLRSAFENPQPDMAIKQLALDTRRKVLLITGASSGSENINDAVCSLLDKLNDFADEWQIVHLAGQANSGSVRQKYAGARISYNVLGYFDDMPNLLAAADLVVGRSGAVSVAEYAAAGVPSICMPYPYHKDRHQYLNAGKLVEAGAAVIVDDLPAAQERAEWLWEELRDLMVDNGKRQQMAEACRTIARIDASSKIAERLLMET